MPSCGYYVSVAAQSAHLAFRLIYKVAVAVAQCGRGITAVAGRGEMRRKAKRSSIFIAVQLRIDFIDSVGNNLDSLLMRKPLWEKVRSRSIESVGNFSGNKWKSPKYLRIR